MPEGNRRGTIVLRDERDPEHQRTQLIDIVKLNDTYKSQPRNNEGPFIHMAPDGRTHADVYLGPHKKEEAGVRITGTVVISGELTSGTAVAMTSGQAFGFAGSIVGISGAIGTVQAVLSGSSLVLSSDDRVYGTIVVGSTLARSTSPFLLSGP